MADNGSMLTMDIKITSCLYVNRVFIKKSLNYIKDIVLASCNKSE